MRSKFLKGQIVKWKNYPEKQFEIVGTKLNPPKNPIYGGINIPFELKTDKDYCISEVNNKNTFNAWHNANEKDLELLK